MTLLEPVGDRDGVTPGVEQLQAQPASGARTSRRPAPAPRARPASRRGLADLDAELPASRRARARTSTRDRPGTHGDAVGDRALARAAAGRGSAPRRRAPRARSRTRPRAGRAGASARSAGRGGCTRARSSAARAPSRRCGARARRMSPSWTTVRAAARGSVRMSGRIVASVLKRNGGWRRSFSASSWVWTSSRSSSEAWSSFSR